MRKIIYLFACFFFFYTPKSDAGGRKDCTKEVRSLIAHQAPQYGYDQALATEAFDLILKLYKVKAIYLDSTRTGMSHYDVVGHILVINKASSVPILQIAFSELVHPFQFNWQPIYYGKNACIVFAKTFLKAVFQAKRERYRYKIDSVRQHSIKPCSRIRAAFIGIYLTDAYCKLDTAARYPMDVSMSVADSLHKRCDRKSFEHQHPEIERALWVLYEDLMSVLPHLSRKEVKKWLSMRKRFMYQDLSF
jgi:hypothetical protein